MGIHSCQASRAGWLEGTVRADSTVAEVTSRAFDRLLKEHNLVASNGYPTRALTIMTRNFLVQSVLQHLDINNCHLGGFITWLDSVLQGKGPSVQGQFFWISLGVCIRIVSGRVIWLRGGAVRHGTTGGARFANGTAM